MRLLATLFLVIAMAHPVLAQDEAGWSFNLRFQGTFGGSDLILKADPSVGYTFNRYFEVYAGLPIYHVSDLSTGMGNAYVGTRFDWSNDILSFSSNLVATAPTGDQDRGFSTGQVTVDWTNTVSRTFSPVTPFASIGMANTVSDTSFFVRPFSSLGLVSHFEGGAMVDVSRLAYVGASAYAVRGSGEQTIVSRVIQGGNSSNRNPRRVFETRTETIGVAEIANDNGFSAWLGVTPRQNVDLQIGYSRSAPYELDTLFFGIGFRVGK